ncbi:glycosyltransferase family 2 protein [Undibacterium sp.]|uniref:glycosyltransferase family 2 protein n=1 Tax=Undibacterium sp. TaxID=1914977 RepID=UPI00374DCD00
MRSASNISPVSISLVIPTFNRAKLVVNTVESALRQTLPFTEIIVVDDGSTDGIQEALAPFGNRISCIRTPNCGVQAARNTGVAAASSEYVTLCDSDDLLQVDFVSTVAPWLGSNSFCDILYSNFVCFDSKKVHADKFSRAPKGYFYGAQSDGDFLYDVPDLYGRTISFQPLFPTGSTFKKAFYESIGGYNPALRGVGSEDWEFALRAIVFGRLALCTKVVTAIRKHDKNQSQDNLRQTIGETKILEYALKHHAAAVAYKETITASIKKRRQNAFDSAFSRGNFDTANEVLSFISERPSSLKFRTKTAIMALPPTVRNAVWRVSQR